MRDRLKPAGLEGEEKVGIISINIYARPSSWAGRRRRRSTRFEAIKMADEIGDDYSIRSGDLKVSHYRIH